MGESSSLSLWHSSFIHLQPKDLPLCDAVCYPHQSLLCGTMSCSPEPAPWTENRYRTESVGRCSPFGPFEQHVREHLTKLPYNVLESWAAFFAFLNWYMVKTDLSKPCKTDGGQTDTSTGNRLGPTQTYFGLFFRAHVTCVFLMRIYGQVWSQSKGCCFYAESFLMLHVFLFSRLTVLFYAGGYGFVVVVFFLFFYASVGSNPTSGSPSATDVRGTRLKLWNCTRRFCPQRFAGPG